jgi:hypothetical protein
MAFNHISFDTGLPHGRLLRDMLNVNENADDRLADVRDMLVQMLSGDGSSDSHYAEIVKRCGVADYDVTQGAASAGQLTAAHNLFIQVDTAFAKRTGSVSGVQSARDQMYSQLRG